MSIRVGRGWTVVWGLTGKVSSGQHGGKNGSLEFPSSIELFETFDSFLSVKCWSHSFPLTDPGMLQCICSGDSLSWIHRQHWIYQILRFRRHRVPFRGRILWSKVVQKGHKVVQKGHKVIQKGHKAIQKGHKDSSKLQARRLSTHIVSSCFNLCIKSMLVLVPEWWISYQKDVQDDSWNQQQNQVIHSQNIHSQITHSQNTHSQNTHSQITHSSSVSSIELNDLEHTTSPNVDGFAIRIFLQNFRW